MMSGLVSIIMPAYNNALTVKKAINSFKTQTVSVEHIELIIIDDVSTDNLEQVIANEIQESYIKFIQNPRTLGAGGSRNRGIDAASGDLIIFCDSDTVPVSYFVEAHLKSHEKMPEEHVIVVGKVAWPPELEDTPLMHLGNVVDTWHGMEDEEQVVDDWAFFRTTNSSVKRNFLDIRFDEDFMRFEDTEFAYRLHLKGMKLLYNPQAISYHYHFRTPEQYISNVMDYGQMLAKWEQRSDPKTADMLNRKFNFLIDRDDICSLKNIREIVRRAVVNDFTAFFIKNMGMWFADKNERISCFCFNKLYKYLFLKGYFLEKSRFNR